MKYFILLLFALINFVSFSQNHQKSLKGLDQELQNVLDTWGVAGFSVAIVNQDGIIYEKGFGYSNREENLKANEHTVYAIGSCTKAFTAALIGQLDSEGIIDINKSPQEYVNYFSFENDEMNNQIKIHDIMCHRTGLPRHDLAWYFFPSDSKEELVKRIAYQEPTVGVRESWQYNNFMYLLQGVIAEETTNKSWESNIEARFFKPLNMTESYTKVDDFIHSKNAAIGYSFDDNLTIQVKDYYQIGGMSPAGSIASSVHDMGKWVQIWINSGNMDTTRIIPSMFHQAAISSQMTIGSGLPSAEHPDAHMSTYGYGWMISSYKGHYRVSHGGNIDGFSANTCFFPSDSVGIIVLCNQEASGIPSTVRNIIADRILNLSKDDWNTELYQSWLKTTDRSLIDEGNEDAKIENAPPSHSIDKYVGRYEHPGYGQFDVTLENGVLLANFPKLTMQLKHYHFDVFEIEPNDEKTADIELKVQFRTDIKGDISGLEITTEMGLDPMEFKRKPFEKKLESNIIDKYVGIYLIQGVELKILINDSGLLTLSVPGQPEYPLIAEDETHFVFQDVDGFAVEFEISDEGDPISILIKQPNGNFKAERKID